MKSVLLLLLFSSALLAADEALDYSMPAAKMTDHHAPPPLPPITLLKNGEFAVQKIRLISDSRQEEQRVKEIRDTMEVLIKQIAGSSVELRFGESTLTAANFKDVPILQFGGKSDVASAGIEVRRKIDPAEKINVVDDIEKLLGGIKPLGRCDIAKEEFGIGISNPEKFRYELIEAMVNDAKKIQGMLGASYTIQINGLDKRMRWARRGFNQLELFLDYNFHIVPVPAK